MTADTAMVYSPFVMRDVLRSIPHGRWSPDEKCWLIDRQWINLCADGLRAAGMTVFVTDPAGRPWSSTGTHGRRTTPATDWITAAFAACTDENVARLKRGLTAAFHPDAGGDDHIMRAILAAAEHRLEA